ncbi:MAG: ATP-binding protein [Thermoprotei archaeon]
MEVEELKRVILDQRELFEDKLSRSRIIPREVKYELRGNNAYLITGPRRAGKSVYAYQMAKDRVAVRVDFEDERLYGLKAKDLNKVLEAAYSLTGGKLEALILDEVQNVEGWELFVSRVREFLEVVVTGSNARLMSREMATFLTGRHLDYVIYPFSFREYLTYKGVEPGVTTRALAQVKSSLRDYLNEGGFPEAYTTPPRLYLRTLFQDVVTRDVAQRCRTRRDVLPLATFLAENVGREVSTRRLGNAFSLSHQTVENYLKCLEDSYLFVLLRRFTGKTLEKYTLPRKVYLIDPALYGAITGRDDLGRKMEDAVLVELLRLRDYRGVRVDVFYHREGDYEVDFVVAGERNWAIQVSYEGEGLRERELKALERFSERFRGFRLFLITWEEEGEEKLNNGRKYRKVPLWKFLTEGLKEGE